MTLETADDEKLHIVMFPWVAFGHMIPYLELAKQIARKGHRVSFLSTPWNADRLPQIPRDLENLIAFVRIPLPRVDGLPVDAEATTDLPSDKIPQLKVAFDLLQEPVTRLLEPLAPDWVIYDFAPYWVGPIARELGIKTVMLNIFTAVPTAFLGPTSVAKGGDYRTKPEDFTVAPKWVPFQTTVAFPYYSIKKMFGDVHGENASGVSDVYRVGEGMESADIIAIRSSYEVEGEWLELLKDLHQKPVFPVGQIPPTPSDYNAVDNSEAWQQIKQWLDSKQQGSVVYVAFGSEAKLTQDELNHIACGLESSGVPFIWVLRSQLGSSDKDRVQLPDGFEKRVEGRGVVWTAWAPQLRILSHGSVGGMLTHSGWSSVVEALSSAKALILFSFGVDQGMNVRFLEEKKIGYAIPREEYDGLFTSEAVAESVRLVMVEEEGKLYRDKAKEMKEVFGNQQLQERYVDNLLNHLSANRPVTEVTKLN